MRRLLYLIILSGFATLSAANGLLQIGYGAKSKGMGGVGIALPQDTFAAAMNPAGMICLGRRGDVGLHWTKSLGNAYFTDTGGITTRFHSRPNLFFPEFGVVYPFGCQSFGLTLVVNGNWVAAYRQPVPGFGTTNLRCEYGQFNLIPSWSWRINRYNAVGVGLNMMYARFKANGLQTIALSSIAPANVTHEHYDWRGGVGIRFGWLLTICPAFKVGLTYQTKTWMSNFQRYRGLIPLAGQVDLPSQLGLGLAWQPHQRFVVSLDAIKICWTNGRFFKNELTAANALLYGANNGPGLGWRDMLVVKVGAALQVTKGFVIRGGYNGGEQPVASSSVFLNTLTLATVQHHVTVGATYCFCLGELSFDYIHGFNRQVRGTDLAGNPVRLEAQEDSVGVSFGRRF